jgi:hypothetical protein
MNAKKILLATAAPLWMFCCKDPKNLQEQLTESFANHLRKVDSSAVLDSVHILWNAKVTQKMGRVIDDSIYRREFIRVQAQLSRAKVANTRDSIDFYQNEIDYMEHQMDAITKSIAEADSTHQFGNLIGTAFYLTLHQKTKMDSTIVYFDSSSTMRYTEFMDSAIRRAVSSINWPKIPSVLALLVQRWEVPACQVIN